MAQQTDSFYFNEFTQGRVILKNKQFARGKFNYDFINQQMHFLDGTTDMIVENLAEIDTVIINNVRFIPFEKRFVEVLYSKQNTLLVDRKRITRERGKQGAMGIATHGSVQSIDVNTRFQRINGDHTANLTIYKDEIEYTYFVWKQKKWRSFSNQVSFLKLYTKNVQPMIRDRIKEAETDFSNPESVLKLMDLLYEP